MPAPDPAVADPHRTAFCGTRAIDDALSGLIAVDANKAAVLEWVEQMVAGGLAEWSLANGEIRIRFVSGEIFALVADGILRLA